ncbi:Transcriptional regulator, TetR family [Actinomycetales bacterium JB111]|nr:Transcriptional regulator, TetR family [Actinomycetales bacterium JB111]
MARAPRNTLTREAILAEALTLADAEGLAALTIRSLAARLGVGPMSLYHHVATKDELLDALTDAVHAELHLPDPARPLRDELEARARSVRAALRRHPWAATLMESRAQPGAAGLRSREAVLEALRANGLGVAEAGHAFAILDAFCYGFALQESMLDQVGLRDSAPSLMTSIDMSAHPRMLELAQEFASGDSYPLDASYEIGLAIVLDGILALRG